MLGTNRIDLASVGRCTDVARQLTTLTARAVTPSPETAATGWQSSSGHAHRRDGPGVIGSLGSSAMALGSSGGHAERDPDSVARAVGFEIDVPYQRFSQEVFRYRGGGGAVIFVPHSTVRYASDESQKVSSKARSAGDTGLCLAASR